MLPVRGDCGSKIARNHAGAWYVIITRTRAVAPPRPRSSKTAAACDPGIVSILGIRLEEHQKVLKEEKIILYSIADIGAGNLVFGRNIAGLQWIR